MALCVKKKCPGGEETNEPPRRQGRQGKGTPGGFGVLAVLALSSLWAVLPGCYEPAMPRRVFLRVGILYGLASATLPTSAAALRSADAGASAAVNAAPGGGVPASEPAATSS